MVECERQDRCCRELFISQFIRSLQPQRLFIMHQWDENLYILTLYVGSNHILLGGAEN